MTTVSGTVTDTQGNAVAGASVTVKYKRPIVGYDGGAVVQNVRQFTTDGSGNLSMADLVPGHYEITIAIVANDNTSLTVLQSTTMTVQDTTTQTLEDALDTNLEITANDVQRAEDAATTATTQAGIATTQAGIATTQAGIATTQAGIATTAAADAEVALDAEAVARAQADADALSDTSRRSFSRHGAGVLDNPALLDPDGRVLAGWDAHGNPALNFDRAFGSGGAGAGGLTLRTPEGGAAAQFDARGNPVMTFGATFSNAGVGPAHGPALIAPGGGVVADLGLLRSDKIITRVTADEPTTGAVKAAWVDRGYVRVSDAPGELYTQARTEFFTDLASLYAQYDALVTAYPDYITRSSLGQDDLNNHIYQYAFSPPVPRISAPATGAYWAEADVLSPKVILMSGLHGSERTAQLGTLIFATNLASNWARCERYSRLRWGARIVVIPAAVPSGVDAGTRFNHNGVDINRNADYFWGDAGELEPGGNQYVGPSAVSETETQILQNLPTTHNDAVAVIDHHNHAQPQAVWFGTSSAAALEVSKESAGQLGSYIHRQLSGSSTDDSATFSWLTKAIPGNVVGHISATGGLDAVYAEEPAVPNDFIDNTTNVPIRRLSENVALTLVDNFVQRELRRHQQS